jgi:hypothetical protein
VYYLYGSKKDVARRLVATFGSEQQLLAYVRWATLSGPADKQAKFEQGSARPATWASNTPLIR